MQDNFKQFEVSNRFFGLLNIFSKETDPINAIFTNIKTFKVATLENTENSEYQYFIKKVNKNFSRKRYKIVLKNKTPKRGKSFYLRANLTHIKELHYVVRKESRVTIISINGRIPIEQLESLSNMVTKKFSKLQNAKDQR